MYKNILRFVITTTFLFLLVGNVHAANVSVRLEQPKSPTNQNTFNINFVTLDIGGNPVTVKCYKKGPSDGGFSQFGSDIPVTPLGGNTGNCSVTGSILNSDGSYQFYTTANNGSETATSDTVTVAYNTSGPDTPTNYSKEKPSSCVYRVKFRTANDSGKTVKVEVYRSENTSFNADSGTRVATVSIGSNTDGQADITSPDCAKTYYFAVRAFDSAGNGSGVTGDSVTNVTTVTASPTPGTGTGAIPVSGGAGGAVLGQKNQVSQGPESGEIKGEATQEATPSSQVSSSPQAEVGAKIGLFSAKNIIIALIVITAAALGFVFIRRKR